MLASLCPSRLNATVATRPVCPVRAHCYGGAHRVGWQVLKVLRAFVRCQVPVEGPADLLYGLVRDGEHRLPQPHRPVGAAVARVFPSRLNATARTRPLWPARVRRGLPVAASHSRTCNSLHSIKASHLT
jgi:hypothetical protein